jgi:hypothetical protein
MEHYKKKLVQQYNIEARKRNINGITWSCMIDLVDDGVLDTTLCDKVCQ